MSSRVRLLPLGLVLAVAVLVAGCGGATLDPVAKAASKTAEAGSFRFGFELGLGLGPGGGKDALAITGDGAYDAALQRLRAGIGVQGKRIEAIVDMSTTPAAYVKPPAGDTTLPPGKTWARLDLADAAKAGGVDLGSLSPQQLDPKQAVEILKQAGDSTKVGDETIDGVETTHYRVVIDGKKAVEQQPKADRKQAEQALDLVGGGSVPLDVWVGRDGLLRRVSAEVGGKDAFFSLKLRFDLTDYGADVRVELPPPAEVADGSSLLPPRTATS